MLDQLSKILSEFKREPSRTGSLIITFYGDAILPRGGSVWLGTLLEFLSLLDIEAGVVRTAMSRLAADGWLDRQKDGRKSYYSLAKTGRERFTGAVEHVYDPPRSEWSGKLKMLLIADSADRDASRPALLDVSFGSPLPGVWVGPADAAVPSNVTGAIGFNVTANEQQGRDLIAASWPLAHTAALYDEFLRRFEPLAKNTAKNIGPEAAIVARVLLIHQYRRVVLRDPLLPAKLLPKAWPAASARKLCATLYRRLLPASEQWLDLHGESLAGRMPPAGAALRKRFGDVPKNMLQK